MRRASDFFTEEERARIEKAVSEAEAKTSAEIVPAVATASGRYDRPEDVVGLWLAVIFMLVAWIIFQQLEQPQPGDWGFSAVRLELPVLVAATVIGFIVGAVLGSSIGWLRRIFTPDVMMRDEVTARAHEVFFDQRIHHAPSGEGVLVYASLFERKALVVGGRAVIEKMGVEALDEMTRKFAGALKSGNPADAFCGAIENAGERLAAVFPAGQGDANELSDTLIILD